MNWFLGADDSYTSYPGEYYNQTRLVQAVSKRGDLKADDLCKEILTEIQDGTFANKWIAENQNGRPEFNAVRRREQDQLLEQVGADLRQMMPFLNPVTIKPGE